VKGLNVIRSTIKFTIFAGKHECEILALAKVIRNTVGSLSYGIEETKISPVTKRLILRIFLLKGPKISPLRKRSRN
jgi:hypothetical protein